MKIAEIHTKKGVMKIKFFEKDAPKAVKNFIDHFGNLVISSIASVGLSTRF